MLLQYQNLWLLYTHPGQKHPGMIPEVRNNIFLFYLSVFHIIKEAFLSCNSC